MTEFATACYDDNSVAGLDAALLGEADPHDCEEWEIDANQWREALREALGERLRDEIDRIGMGSEIAGPTCLRIEVDDDGSARIWDDQQSLTARSTAIYRALRTVSGVCDSEDAWTALSAAREEEVH